MKECVTHHNACDCREEMFRLVEERLAIAKAALEFYASARTEQDEVSVGDRMEFGCGCCAGTIAPDGMTDYDKDVIGLTAREALEKMK